MNSLSELAARLKREFGLLELPSLEALAQNGDYLVFEGLESVDDITDNAVFSVVVARNSLNADKSDVLDKIDRLRGELFRFGARYGEKVMFGHIASSWMGLGHDSLRGYLYALLRKNTNQI